MNSSKRYIDIPVYQLNGSVRGVQLRDNEQR